MSGQAGQAHQHRERLRLRSDARGATPHLATADRSAATWQSRSTNGLSLMMLDKQPERLECVSASTNRRVQHEYPMKIIGYSPPTTTRRTHAIPPPGRPIDASEAPRTRAPNVRSWMNHPRCHTMRPAQPPTRGSRLVVGQHHAIVYMTTLGVSRQIGRWGAAGFVRRTMRGRGRLGRCHAK